MNAVKNDIKKLIDKELEEAEDEYEKASRFLDYAWRNIKHDDTFGFDGAKTWLADMYKAAMNLAVEAVQVAAMCKKAQFVGIPVEEEKNNG